MIGADDCLSAEQGVYGSRVKLMLESTYNVGLVTSL